MEKTDKLYHELVEGFILREYYMMFPEMQIMGDIKEQAVKKYQTDPYFHSRIQSVVGNIMAIVKKYL